MPMVAQPLRVLPAPWKMDNRLLAVRAKNKMASVGSLRNGNAEIGIPQPSLRDVLSDFTKYATVGEHSRLIWRTGFNIDRCATVWTI
jgi:hypothetical protein